MPTKTTSTPSYRLYRRTGQAVVTIDGKDRYLGRHGSPESKAEYDRIIGEWLARGRRSEETEPAGISVNELCLAWLGHAETIYQRDGVPTTELSRVKGVLRHVQALYDTLQVKDFGPLRLKALRQRFIDHGGCRRTVNASTMIVKRMFKWGVSEELVPADVWHGLQAVAGLRLGQSNVREAAPVRCVPDDLVDATLPHVLPEVAAMIRLQRITGMRSGELTRMTTGTIDASGEVWTYRPVRHKTQHHGHVREVFIGPKAQEILRPWLRPNLGEYLFSPQRAVREKHATSPTHRRQPVKKPKTKRRIKDRYSVTAYHRAIQRGCELAFPPPEHLRRMEGESPEQYRDRLQRDGLKDELRAWRREHSWHPHQLRHNAATTLRKEYGLEIARAVLGQTTVSAAQIYAEMDQSAARGAMLKIG
jgi:integrase